MGEEEINKAEVLSRLQIVVWDKWNAANPGADTCVAGSTAMVQAERNNDDHSNTNNDVDIWRKETRNDYVDVDRITEFVKSLNRSKLGFKVELGRIVLGHTPLGVNRRHRPGVSRRLCRRCCKYKQPKIGFVADLTIKVNGKEITPVQLVGQWCELDDELSFPERVVTGFDLSCVQCWIAVPDKPKDVYFLSPQVKDDVLRKRMCADTNKYRGDKVLEDRVGKYMARGYCLTRLLIGKDTVVLLTNASLSNSLTMRNLSGDRVNVGRSFEMLRGTPNKFINAIEAMAKSRLRETDMSVARRSKRLNKKRKIE